MSQLRPYCEIQFSSFCIWEFEAYAEGTFQNWNQWKALICPVSDDRLWNLPTLSHEPELVEMVSLHKDITDLKFKAQNLKMSDCFIH